MYICCLIYVPVSVFKRTFVIALAVLSTPIDVRVFKGRTIKKVK